MAVDGSTGGPAGAGSQERIKIFVRLRPTPRPTGRVLLGAAEEPPWVEFNVPKNPTEGLINNSRESYRFTFDGLLPPDAAQDEVFERVALPVLRSSLDGYNGTVFAFGQTGSGKTFTITGGAERYADRGLLPRALSALFAEAARRTGHTYSVHVSYMEIYNETGYDLLDPGREVRALEDLPKVHIMEDEDSRMHFRGLSLHRCDTEEQALNMLFLGDTNRVVAETPLNQASSRSHCVFTLHIEARRGGEAVVRRSKLHFVDLAGSERAGKTGLAAHTQLKEAKYINLSLHFLEQVIISLQEGRPHIPYRNSMLTMVLRDSLGGNTRTVMVAAVAPEAQHIEESISTCRFAQRVAMISNKVEVNEELDLEVVIRKLKAENTLLRQELQLLRSGAGTGAGRAGSSAGGQGASDDSEGSSEAGGREQQRTSLTEGEQHVLRRQVAAFVEDPSPDAVLNLEASMVFIRAAFDMLKGMVRAGAGGSSGNGAGGLAALAQQRLPAGRDSQAEQSAAAELRSLRQLVQQQEQQIGVLTGMIRKQGLAPPNRSSIAVTGSVSAHSRQSSGGSSSSSSSAAAATTVPGALPAVRQQSSAALGGLGGSPGTSLGGLQQEKQQQEQLSVQPALQQMLPAPPPHLQQPCSAGNARIGGQHTTSGTPPSMPAAPATYSDDLLADQHKAFEYFCATSPAHDTVAEHKAVLRGWYEEARALGSQVNAAKRRIGELKSSVEQRRLARSMAALLRQQQQGSSERSKEEEEAAEQRQAEAEEERAKALIEQEKAAYRGAYGKLRGVKVEIEGVQAALEHARARLQHDFQVWYAAMAGTGSGSVNVGGMTIASAGAISELEQVHAAGLSPHVHSPQVPAVARPGSSSSSTSRGGSWAAGSRYKGDEPGPALGAQLSLGSPKSSLADQQHGQRQQQQAAEGGTAPSAAATLLSSFPGTSTAPAAGTTQWPQQHQQQRTGAAGPPPQQQSQLPQQQQQREPAYPYAGVEPDVLAAAKPLLTGNPQADADIIKFYQARAALLKGMR